MIDWTPESLAVELAHRIDAAIIDASPFPHVIITELLPPDLYQRVLVSIPSRDQMNKVDYPGTGFGQKAASHLDYGYAYPGLSGDVGPLGIVHGALASDRFSVALLQKFSQPTDDGSSPIPSSKHVAFKHGAKNCSTVFDLQLDLPGYAIPPHPDVPSKIVTFQLYLTADDELAAFGTHLCAPKTGLLPTRRLTTRAVARLVDLFLVRSNLYRRIERSDRGLELGVGAGRNWFPWSWFDIVKTAEARPNHFLAFAPNDRSFHAVDLNIPEGMPTHERAVIRGFIRVGKDTSNWISPHTNHPRASRSPR